MSLDSLLGDLYPPLAAFFLLPNAPATVLLALLGLVGAFLIADGMTRLRVAVIGAFAIWMIRAGSSDFGITAGAFTIFEALRGADQLRIRGALARMEAKVMVLHDLVEPFMDALEKRSHQIDVWKAEADSQAEAITPAPKEEAQ